MAPSSIPWLDSMDPDSIIYLDSMDWPDSMDPDSVPYLDNIDRDSIIQSQNLEAWAQYALSRIVSRPQSFGEQRYWKAEISPDSPTYWEARPRPTSPNHHWEADLSLPSPVRKRADTQAVQSPLPSTSPSSLLPPVRVNQQVLIIGRPLKWNIHTIFTVTDIYTRDLKTMQKTPWTPQTIHPMVELRLSCTAATDASGTDALALPLSQVVPLPYFFDTPESRYRMFRYSYYDAKGVRMDDADGIWARRDRRYVDKFLGVWAERGGVAWGPEQAAIRRRGQEFGGDVKNGEVYVLVEWVDGAPGSAEMVKVRDLSMAEKSRWKDDVDEILDAKDKARLEGKGEPELNTWDTDEDDWAVLKELGLE